MKTTILKRGLLLTITLFAFQINAQKFTFSTGLDSWDLAYGAAGSASGTVTHSATEGLNGDGALVLARTTNNSNFGLNPAGIDASTKKFIKVRFKNETNGTQLRVQGSQPADNSDLKITNTVFNIGANSSEYVTAYLDMSNVTNWGNTIENLDILIRNSWAAGEGNFYLDEIEFLETMPATTYSEFIQNPGFDGPSGINHLSGVKPFASRAITSAVKHDGDQSLKSTFSADANEPYWAFSDYIKTYTTKYPVDSDIQIKMWVKTNRTSVFSVSARVKLYDGGEETATKPITSVTTTNTTGDWEELTFDLKNVEVFDGISFWFALDYVEGAATNLMSGDIVYIDHMTGSITEAVLNTEKNILEGVHVYPNPVSGKLNINTIEGGKISLFNILGAKVVSETTTSKNHTIETSSLTSGVYLLNIVSNGKSFTQKLIIK